MQADVEGRHLFEVVLELGHIKREPLRFPSFFMILFLVLVCLFGGLLILPLFLEGGLSHGLALLKLAV